jgi:hypothetical protein
MTGYRHEIDAFVQKQGIKAEELPLIAEAEYITAAWLKARPARIRTWGVWKNSSPGTKMEIHHA